ncbi:MAG: hypothetical protein RMK29_17460 [Myxococcales bacterium]|nr:hypothetical protein [Myxococcota bacterium]MDW8283499.1 hypothetical protein [Myxococcales bacterium]
MHRWVLVSALALLACGQGEVQIHIVPPLQPEVGVEMAVPLHAYAGGRAIDWSWRSLTNPALAGRNRRPTLTAYTGGTAVWRWTPIGEDRGEQEIEFTARAGADRNSAVLHLVISEGGKGPVFREPIGEGTTLDLRMASCVRVRVVVESTASARVDLGLRDPPDNVELAQTSHLGGELTFCPSMRQIMEETVYPITLTAHTASHLATKVYVIVLRRA